MNNEHLISNTWDEILKGEYAKPYFINLQKFLDLEYESETVYPSRDNIYSALKLTPYDKVKVVILGQDPYHEPNQAHGLAFSVLDGTPLPKSLINIFKELESEYGMSRPKSGNLTSWTNQGVLLLNTVLTVRKGQAYSHAHRGWEEFTDAIIKALDSKEEPIVFILWGNGAIGKSSLITNPLHLVLKGPHPSPLSAYRGFFGCDHFKKANEFLVDHQKSPVDWTL